MASSERALERAIAFFFFNDTATTEIYTLSLHDALPISVNLGNDAKPVLTQRTPRLGHVHYRVNQADQRRELDRAVQPHDLDRLAHPCHVFRRGSGVLGADPKRGGPRLGPVQWRGLGGRDDQPAGAEAQVAQLVVRAWRLPQLVLARKAQVGRTVIDVCGNVGRLDQDHAQPVLFDQQLAPNLLLVQVGGTRPAQHIQATVKKEAGGNRYRDQSASLPPPPAPPGTPPTSPPREAGFAQDPC